ncbi:MAG TPA: VOC family protein [Mycobacteriales bacterium]|nr:VOC family protein [Mycobacteriales bacterium]
MRLHHVNVVVRPGETGRVAAFYTHVLGLRRVEKPAEGTTPGGAWFDVNDGAQVHISERADAAMHDDSHFALVLDDFDDVLGRLERAGAAWQPQAEIFGARRGSTRDPLGNRIELLEAGGRLGSA